jgi:uncharacterized protein YqjF (DUF2071 family)
VFSRNDFDYGLLDAVAHRPWPLPARPWVMTQSWHDLLFAHWAIDRDRLRALVPAGIEIDLHDGQAWLGIVPFHMTNVAPRGVPNLPWVSAFPELNVRTYVVRDRKPGVYFFSLDAANPLAVAAARALFNLPYYAARMHVETADGSVRYESRRTGKQRTAALSCRYRPMGGVSVPVPGTLEHFLTERYCLYVVDSSRVRRLEIHHRPWRLQPAELEIATNTMADAAGVSLPPAAPLLHFSARQDMVAFPMETVE